MTEDTNSTFGFQIQEEEVPTAEVKLEVKPPKRKPKQKKVVVEKPADVKEEAEKLLFDEAAEKPEFEAPLASAPAVEKKPEPKPAPVLKAPPVRPVLYGLQKVKRRLKERRNLT